MKHSHEIDGKLHRDCEACDYIRDRTSATRLKAQKEVDNDLGQIAKTAMKAERAKQ